MMLRISHEYITLELVLKIINLLFKHRLSWVKSNYISMSQDYFGKSIEALWHYFRKLLSIVIYLLQTHRICLHLSD